MNTVFTLIIETFFRIKRKFGFVVDACFNSFDLSLEAGLKKLLVLSLEISEVFFPYALKQITDLW